MDPARTAMLEPVTLTGCVVRLEPLSATHHDGLVEAVQDGNMWERWYTQIPRPEAMGAEIERRLARHAAGTMLPFVAIRHADNRVLGMTTYYDADPAIPRLEIGYTWNRASTHGTGTNAESKLLLLTHAFETLHCASVGFRTQWPNHQSRRAIERLGAKQDGVLRAHRRTQEGVLMDMVVYSILASEWEQVRRGLEDRLNSRRR